MAQKTKLPENEIQKLMRKAMRGVAPLEHDNNVDISLVIAYQNGSEEAGLELVKSYNDVFTVIMNKPTKPPKRTKAMQKLFADPTYQDYEDLFQEILFHFLKLAHEFDTDIPIPFSHKVRATLHQRVFNNFFSEFLENKMNETEYDDAIHGEAVETNIFIEKEAHKVPAQYLELYQALNQLGKRQREVVEFSIVKGWNATEISKEIGIAPATVRVTLKKALGKLKEIMVDQKTEEVV